MNFRQYSSSLLTGVLIISAVLVTGLVVYQSLNGFRDNRLQSRIIERWSRLTRINSEAINQKDIVIIEFFDYQCPYCRTLQPRIQQLISEFETRISVSYRHLPLTIHENALLMAIASECARLQGYFQQYHSALFDSTASNSVEYLTDLGRHLHIPNISEFSQCITSKRTLEIVQTDIEMARKNGITSIPTLVINGRVVVGAVSYRELRELVYELQ